MRIRILQLRQEECRDPTHYHNAPIQRMGAFEINGHPVEVEQDGPYFNCRIDDIFRIDLTASELDQFIQEYTA